MASPRRAQHTRKLGYETSQRCTYQGRRFLLQRLDDAAVVRALQLLARRELVAVAEAVEKLLRDIFATLRRTRKVLGNAQLRHAGEYVVNSKAILPGDW